MSARPRIVAFTGAGISASAGLGTYRGPDGLWTRRPDLEQLMTARGWMRDPRAVWAHLSDMREAAAAAEPTVAHQAIAAAQEWADVTVVTQNIDGLHQRAGSTRVVELHGSAWAVRCPDPGCGFRTVLGFDNPRPSHPVTCEVCVEALRPDVVLFDEMLDGDTWDRAAAALGDAEHVVVVGTSGTVYPARYLIDPTPRSAVSVDIIVSERWDNPHSRLSKMGTVREHIGAADELLCVILDRIRAAG